MNRTDCIYMDHAATTPTDPQVLQAMLPFFTERYGNPATIYSLGTEAKAAVEEARASVAALIGCRPDEVYFTGGATEADNWAIKGTAWANESKGRHIITSAIEHHAVLEPCEFLEKHGFEVTYVRVGSDGIVDPEDVRKAIRPDTILITIMHSNNEVGTIQPVEEIGKIAAEHKILFHTDAVQSAGKVPLDVKQIGCDMMSLSAHKLYGPKGVGALYIRKGARVASLLQGGGQESKRRAGTLNVPGIVGMGAAFRIGGQRMEADNAYQCQLRDRLIEGILQIPDSRLNGHPTKRLPNNVNVCIEGAEGEAMLLALDEEGICVSSGSACTSGTLDPSHVLLAMGVPPEIAHGSLRITVGRSNTMEHVERLLEVLPRVVERFRSMNPWYRRSRSIDTGTAAKGS
ncbi:MAG: cysteine desulfurase NifS [Armatimonadota bacterium]